MQPGEFQKFMEDQGLQVKQKIAYGNIQGYPVLIYNKWGNRVLVSFFLEGVAWSEIREKMVSYAKTYKIKVYYEDNQVVWSIHITNKESYRFSEILDGVVRIFKRKKIKSPHTCVICKEEPKADSFAVLQGANRPVHRSCLQKMLEQAREDMQSGSYLLGILGGILGCIFGCMPCALSLLLAKKTFCVLFLCIPPGVYAGCKWCKGKMNQFVILLSVLFSFASVYILEFPLRIQYNMELNQFPHTPYYYWTVIRLLVTNPETWYTITQSVSVNVLFVLLGILINWEIISHTSIEAERNIVEVINTENSRRF